jgi:hypothetical protein
MSFFVIILIRKQFTSGMKGNLKDYIILAHILKFLYEIEFQWKVFITLEMIYRGIKNYK